MALLMLPMMLAPALVGLMYRLVLHEFVGVVPYYLYLYSGDSPAFLGPANAFKTLVTIEVLQWTPFALLILYSAYAGIPMMRERRPPSMARAVGASAPHRPAADAADDRHHLSSSASSIRFRVFDNVYVLTARRRRLHHDDLHLHLRGVFPRSDIGFAVAASLIFLAPSSSC